MTLRILPEQAKPTPKRWTGTYDYRLSHPVPAGDQISTAHVDLQLAEDVQGALTGTAEGDVTAELYLKVCRSSTVKPAHLQAELAARRTPSQMDLQLVSQSWGPIQITPCPRGNMPAVIGGGKIYFIEEALKTLTSRDGRIYRFHSEKSYPNPAGYPFTVTHTIEVQQVP